MGCNSSKRKDTQQATQPQQRTRPAPTEQQGAGGAGADDGAGGRGESQPMSMPSRLDQVQEKAALEGRDALGATPSDSRMQENEDFYQMIVQGYEGDAIDVKSDREQVARSLDDHDDELALEGLDTVPVAPGHPTRRLPPPREGLDLATALARPAAAPEMVERVEEAVAKLAAVLPRVTNEDSPIQSFPEIPQV